jgi:hypothetical protein
MMILFVNSSGSFAKGTPFHWNHINVEIDVQENGDTPFPLEENGSFLALSKAFTHTFRLYSYGGKGVCWSLRTKSMNSVQILPIKDSTETPKKSASLL